MPGRLPTIVVWYDVIPQTGGGAVSCLAFAESPLRPVCVARQGTNRAGKADWVNTFNCRKLLSS